MPSGSSVFRTKFPERAIIERSLFFKVRCELLFMSDEWDGEFKCDERERIFKWILLHLTETKSLLQLTSLSSQSNSETPPDGCRARPVKKNTETIWIWICRHIVGICGAERGSRFQWWTLTPLTRRLRGRGKKRQARDKCFSTMCQSVCGRKITSEIQNVLSELMGNKLYKW